MKKIIFVLAGLLALATLVACKPVAPIVETTKYTVTFVTNGGSAIVATEVEENKLLSQPTDPTRDDFTFAGWYKDATLANKWLFASDLVTANMTLYAKWTPVDVVVDSFDVSFNSNGGSTVDLININKGQLLTKPTDPTKAGFEFEGWYKESALTTKWVFATDVVNSEMTLYANWVETATAVSFETNGGSLVPKQELSDEGSILRPTDPTKADALFAGWYKDQALESLWDFETDVVSSSLTLYAKWKIQTNYNQTFKVLSIGNSFSEDAHKYLYKIALSYGIAPENIVIANMYIGGSELATHANNINSDAAAYQYQLYENETMEMINGVKLSAAIRAENWDVVTFQQASHYSGLSEKYANHISTLTKFVESNATNANVEILWHMTWAYQQTSTHSGFANYNGDQMTMYNGILSAITDKIDPISQVNGVVPSGTAIQNARTSYLGDLFTRDGYHLSDPLGRYIAGLMFFKSITGFDLVKETIYKPTGITDDLQALAIESVEHAYETPYAVTNSTYTTEPEPEEVVVNGVLFEFDYAQGFWADNATAISPTSDALHNSFVAVMPISKSMFPVGSEIVLAPGYQYRTIFFEKIGEVYKVVSRSALYQATYLELDADFWGTNTYIGFNITTNPTSNVSTRLDEVAGKMKLYHPEGTGQGHIDTEVSWTTGYWALDGHAKTASNNHLSTNPLTPDYYNFDTVVEVMAGYKVAYAVLTYSAGQYTVSFVSSFQTESIYVDTSFATGKELIAFIVTSTTEDTDLSLVDATTIVDMHPQVIPHVDSQMYFMSGYWEANKTSITTTNANMTFLNGFAASQPQSKAYYQDVNSITLEANYQVRVIFLSYDGFGEYKVLKRTDNLSGTIVLDETMWSTYEYIAFNISTAPSSDLSGLLDLMSSKFSFDRDALIFTTGYWDTNKTVVTASTSFAASNVIPRQFIPAGTTLSIEAGYQVRLVFFNYVEGTGFKVASRSDNMTGQIILTDGFYKNYQYIGFNISTVPSSNLSTVLDDLPAKITYAAFTDEIVEHVDEPLSFISGYWENAKNSITTTNANMTFLNGFAASNVLSKASLAGFGSLEIAEGYQVRIVYLDYSFNTYTVLLRTNNVTGTIVMDEAFWEGYQYVAFNISSVPTTDLSVALATLPSKIDFFESTLIFSSGYWDTNKTILSANNKFAASQVMPKHLIPAGTTLLIESGYQIRILFFEFIEGEGYKVMYKTENYVGQVVLTEGLYKDYQYVAFNISTIPQTDISGVLEDLPSKVIRQSFTAEVLVHTDVPQVFVSGYWNNYMQAVTPGTDAFSKGFAATNVVSKTSLAEVLSVDIASGYQVRVVFLDYSFNSYTVLFRTANLTGNILMDETFWADYQYVAFNISSVPASDLSETLETLPALFTFNNIPS